MVDSFYITLPSNSSMSLYTNNTTTQFTTQLRESVKLQGEYEVALVELHFPQTFFNVSNGQNEITVSYGSNETDQQVYVTDVVLVKPGFYSDSFELINAVNNALASTGIANFIVDSSTQGGYLQVNSDLKTTPTVFFSPELSLQLGYKPGVNAVEHPQPTDTFNLSLGTPQHIMVYCDIVEPQIVGDTVAPLLRMINTRHRKHSFGEEVTASFLNLQYIPVLKREFSTIEIYLRSSIGLPVPFQTGTSAVVLHFRRRF